MTPLTTTHVVRNAAKVHPPKPWRRPFQHRRGRCILALDLQDTSRRVPHIATTTLETRIEDNDFHAAISTRTIGTWLLNPAAVIPAPWWLTTPQSARRYTNDPNTSELSYANNTDASTSGADPNTNRTPTSTQPCGPTLVCGCPAC